jgi:hypothetical protein
VAYCIASLTAMIAVFISADEATTMIMVAKIENPRNGTTLQ